MINKLKTETGPRIFTYLEKRITDNGGKFLVGDAYTYADVVVACFIDNMSFTKTKEECEAIGAKYPNLSALGKAIAATPEIKAWIEKRPKTEF